MFIENTRTQKLIKKSKAKGDFDSSEREQTCVKSDFLKLLTFSISN